MTLNTKVYWLEGSKSKTFKYWIRLCTGIRGKYIMIPLKENTYFESQKNILNGRVNNSVQLNFDKNKNLKNITLSLTIDNLKLINFNVEKLALDIGLKNYITTSEGDFFGKNYYKTLQLFDFQISNLFKELKRRGKKPSDNKKYNDLVHRCREFIKNETNRILNRIIKLYNPREIVVENLDFKNITMFSKKLMRMIRNFGLGQIKQKLKYLNEEYGIIITEINPAYTSQECSSCGYVDHRNRQGDKFKCKCCGHKSHGDMNSTKTIRRRSTDLRIHKFMSKEKILKLIINDFVVNSKFLKVDDVKIIEGSLSSTFLLGNKYRLLYLSSLLENIK